MPDTGWKFPGTVSGVTPAPHNDWSNADNVKLDDGTFARWVGSKYDGADPGDGPALQTSNYNFNIHPRATIVGVDLKVNGYDSNSLTWVGRTYLKYNGLPYLAAQGSPALFQLGTDTKDWDPPNGAGSPLILRNHVFGNKRDMWGVPLTPSIVNDSSFGWDFMIYDSLNPLDATIYYMQMRVHYRLPNPVIVVTGI